MDELEDAVLDNCELPVKGGKENVHGKVNILIQTHISRHGSIILFILNLILLGILLILFNFS